MKLSPLRDRVVVKKDPVGDKIGSLIFLPDSAKKSSCTGTVREVGPGRENKEGILQSMSVRVGDKVVFPRFSGTDLKEIEEDLFLLSENEILAVLD